MKPYRSFNLILLGVVAGSSSLVAGFNVAIDPFGVMDTPMVKGVNQSKPETVYNTRLYKAIDLTRQNAKTIFLGASRVEEGLNPEHPALAAYQPVYNLAMPAASFYEQRRYLEHALATQKNLEVVILGIDLWLLSHRRRTRSGFQEARLGKNSLRFSEALKINLSWDTFDKSWETLEKNLRAPESIYYYSNGVRDVDYLKNIEFTSWLPSIVNNPKDFISPVALKNFKKIRDICKNNGLKLKAFITPPHVTQFEAIYMAGGEKVVIEQGKREIVKILPVWDFSGYNSITTEPINSEMTKYRDSSHHTMKVGDLILNRILQYREQETPPDFGIWITPDNIEEHLIKIRADREVWRKENPDTVKMLEDFKR